jgi:hypothetical protein
MTHSVRTCLVSCIWASGLGNVQTRKIIVPSLGRRVNRGPFCWSVPQTLDCLEIVLLFVVGKSVPYELVTSDWNSIRTYQDFLTLG